MIFVVALATGAPAAFATTNERGRYLVTTILACGNCHSPRDAGGAFIPGRELSGGLAFDIPPFAGTASNITPDRETGIGTWSDAEIKAALTKGERPAHAPLAGVPLGPIMPVAFYKAILPADLDAIVAYLRSVPAVRNPVPPPVYRMAPTHQPYPDASRSYGAPRDAAERGRYLATIGHCMECHTPVTRAGTDYETAFGKGGRAFTPALVAGLGPSFTGSTSPNITSHATAGIGAWSDAEIRRAITSGIGRDGRALNAPMGFSFYAALTARDLDDLVAWLRTVPPLP
ncbi:MAG: c-type cytochrome [Alphaproteobacteria bacterium]